MDNPYEVAVCYVIEPNVPECWRVSIGPPNKLSSRWVDFRGKDAQRLAYEYAAGVLGKKDVPKPDPFFSAYEKARASAPPSPWISVKERMPERNRTVWVAAAGMCRTAHYRGARHGLDEFYDSFGKEMLSPVTYWMPLPEPPKE